MKNQVTIAKHPETGDVITVNTNKPAYGTIRVDEESVSMENGFFNKTRRSAFIAGKLEDLKSMNFQAGDKIAGKIVRTETREAQFEGQEPKKYPEFSSDGVTPNPKAGETVLVDGAPVYFSDEYTADLTQSDALIKGQTNYVEAAKPAANQAAA